MYRLAIITGFLASVFGVAAVVWWTTLGAGLDAAAAKGRSDLSLAADRLVLELQRARDLSVHLADDPRVLDSLTGQAEASQVASLLRATADRAGASDIVLMRPDGRVSASASGSAEAAPTAIWLERATHGALGYGPSPDGREFINAAPVFARDGQVAGAVVVNRSLPTIERSWRGQPQAIYFSDPSGRVLVTNREELRGQAPEGVRVPMRGLDLRRLEAGRYVPRNALHLELPLPVIGLTAEILVDIDPAQRLALAQAVAVGAVLMVVGAALAFLWARRRTLALANAQLEARVAERTAELSTANARLKGEVRERREAEAALTRAQAELVQASKLSALGQMSAGISHELNQPLMALRSFAGNAETFLERGNTEAAARNLSRIADLARRMGRIIRNLRAFARAEPEPAVPTDLCAVLASALEITEARRAGEGVETRVTAPTGPVWAMGGEVRLAQVLVNLLTNAVDATEDQAERRVEVTLTEAPPRFTVRDSGRGLADPASIFDPFYSTKEVGQGLGLGLSISYGIVSGFGGRIAGRNAPDGGAEFTVELIAADPVEEAA
ncbi:ATP-binding protein [Jannaschia sp. M317]|uniref:sensor histidine kinase n=1 Tax=Jannaschia sp. M317 TaxID=2867011 RepID=UPI0021A88044|nr:ATP-binding protein [Jannaschia sp. M317]UWQ16375.1 sensor histidine kinase [Jannaschia sp. M317]